MTSSIQHFNEVSVYKFADLEDKLYKRPQDLDSYIAGVSNVLKELGTIIVKETLENLDKIIQSDPRRLKNWVVEDHDKKQLLTSLGNVTFTKTLYAHKTNKTEDGKQEMCYLLDKVMGFTENQRMTDEVKAKIYEEAVQTSYRRAGEVISAEDTISKEAVKDLLHKTSFPPNFQRPKKKKQVKFLYIDADEDHFHLQFQNNKGDLEIGTRGRKNNGAITKLIYVYEGIVPESLGSKRNKLVGAHFFCRGTNQNNQELWQEVMDYIDATYETELIEKIYINADGGLWINEGKRAIVGARFVLDEFHLRKYVSKLCSHMLDSAEDAQNEAYEIIREHGRKDFAHFVEELKEYAKDEVTLKRIDSSGKYILSNWSAAVTRLKRCSGIVGSSTEGHVYHILSKRMSTNPLGWSRQGGDQMGRLLEYHFNGGDMLELARYQKQELPVAAGAEELVESVKAKKVERTIIQKQCGKYFDAMQTTLTLQKKKQYEFWMHGQY